MEKEVKMKPEDKEECKDLLNLSDKLKKQALSLAGTTALAAFAFLLPGSNHFIEDIACICIGGFSACVSIGSAVSGVLTYRSAISKFGKAAVQAVQKEMEADEQDLNKQIAKTKKYEGIDVAKNLNKLQDKEKFISGFSKKLRKAREDAVSQAEKKGKPLSAPEVMKLRKAEEMKRFEANKKLMEKRKNER